MAQGIIPRCERALVFFMNSLAIITGDTIDIAIKN
jgi:hypothetical protein